MTGLLRNDFSLKNRFSHGYCTDVGSESFVHFFHLDYIAMKENRYLFDMIRVTFPWAGKSNSSVSLKNSFRQNREWNWDNPIVCADQSQGWIIIKHGNTYKNKRPLAIKESGQKSTGIRNHRKRNHKILYGYTICIYYISIYQ